MKHSEIDDLIRQIEATDLAALGRALHQALETERKHPSTPDGFPSSTIGAPPPVASGRSDNEEAVHLTSVEQAAYQRGKHRDEYRDTLRDAYYNLLEATNHLGACRNKLARLVQLQQDHGLEPTEPGCWVMARIGKWEPVFRRSDLGGILDEPRPLGRWAYEFIVRNDRQPTVDEIRRRHDGRKVYTKAS